MLKLDFPGSPVVKNLPVNVGDPGSIPGLGRSPMPRGNKPHLNLDEKEELNLGRHLLALEIIWRGRGEVLRLHDGKTAISHRRYLKNMHIKKASVSEDNSSASMKKYPNISAEIQN